MGIVYIFFVQKKFSVMHNSSNSPLSFLSYSKDANIRLYRLQKRSCLALSKILTSTQMNRNTIASKTLSLVSNLNGNSETPDLENGYALMGRFLTWKDVMRKRISRQDDGVEKLKEMRTDYKASLSNMSADLNALLITRGLESTKRYSSHNSLCV